MIISRFFDLLMWVVIASIIVLVFLRAGGTTISLTKILSGAWLKQTAILSGAPLGRVEV